MMAAATHSYQASLTDGFLKSPGFFTSAFLANEGQNPFDDSFRESNGKMAGASQSLDPGTTQTAQGHTDDAFLRPFSNGSFSPMFSFSPGPRSPALNPSNVDAASIVVPSATWTPQNPTPPNSARSPVVNNWKTLPDHSIPSINPEPTMGHGEFRYGQITPSGDDDEPLVTFAFDQVTLPSQPPTTTRNKRKRSVAKVDATQSKSITKRRRKSTARAKPMTVEAAEEEQEQSDDDDDEADMGEDGKRSRFLERNRVAASKCRQKKKEWTNNLESRARELQHQKSQLTAMVSSLKDEMLWLKGELLKHGTCGCDKIRQYLNHEATHFAAGTVSRRQSHLLAASSPTVQRPSLEDSPLMDSGPSSHVGSPLTAMVDPEMVKVEL